MSLATRNIEPIPGYVLRERIGAGGYGEVWKADAPGGLAKAIKLVYGYADGDRASREMKAMSLIKSLRHPFLLSLERIEIIDGQLVIVTELADCSLKDRFELRRSEGLRGIPRPELLQFMRDAADALDYMNEQHSLQHLDVKPENLLLVGDHVKVADFGLVKDVQKQTASMLGGLTPVYASPELFSGAASRRSDQYSLAIVYQEMLTGVLPFPGKTAAQLAAQHLNAKPLLFALPPGERKVVARALAKDPARRFAHCRELVEHLQDEVLQASLPPPETWFGAAPGPVGEENGGPDSTMCLNTARLSQALGQGGTSDAERNQTEPLSTPESGQSAHAEPYSASDDAWRSSDDMFGDLDDADKRLETEFNPTFVVRRIREPRIESIDAPQVSGDVALRPTVIVGIGNIASQVMQKLKQRLVDRMGKAEACPAIQFLFLDADPQGVQRTARGDDGAPLDPQEVMLLGLRKSQEYRSESPALLQWLSRRWLYNIPRSQTPEGLRPLGRLALADHARAVRDRIRKSLQKAVAPESAEAAQKSSGLPYAGPPRVIVLGAICGGTAGGMMLDVCFLARQILERVGNAERDVIGLMMHYRGRQPAAHELAIVNTYATLAELDYYTRPEKAFPGDPSCGLEPRKEDHAPMREGYFLHLGDFLSDSDLGAAADRVAEYLYLDCFTSSSQFFTACRRAPGVSDDSRSIRLRNFGVSQVGFSSGELIPWAAMSLCTDLFQRWLGEGQKTRAEMEAAAEQETGEYLTAQGLGQESLLESLLTELGRRLPEKPDVFFRSQLVPAGKTLDAATLAHLDFNVVLFRVNEVLAQRGEETLGPEAKYPETIQLLLAQIDSTAKKQAKEIGAWLIARTQTPGPRLGTSEKAAQCISKHLTRLFDEARRQRKELQESLHRFELLLGAGDAAPAAKLPPLRRSPQDYEAHYLEYMRLRMSNVALFFLQELAKRIKNALVGVNDQLNDARRDLKGLIAQMNPGELAESPSSELEGQLRQALLAEFATQRGKLAGELDAWAQGTLIKDAGGFIPAVSRGGEHRITFVNQLFHASRGTLLRSLEGLDVANFLLEQTESKDGQMANRLRGSLDAARPKPLADANCRTLIAISHASDDPNRRRLIGEAVREHTGSLPTVIGYRESDVAIVSELADLSVAEIAVRLIDERSDYVEYARRVFARSDIPFEPLTLQAQQTEEEAYAK